MDDPKGWAATSGSHASHEARSDLRPSGVDPGRIAAFTPGPWRAMPEEADKPYIRIRGTRLGERYKIANVLMPEYDSARETEAPEMRANSCLVAAAPELYEAVRLFVEYDTGGIEDGVKLMLAYANAIEAAKIALAKAQGTEARRAETGNTDSVHDGPVTK